MKHIRRWLIRIGVALSVLVIILAGLAIWFARRPFPEVSGTLSVSGLTAPVQVIRDQRGAPYIYARNEHDLLFTQGYVHAQDRLWQMEMERRSSSGTLSEIVGGAAVDADSYVRGLGLRRVAERSWQTLDDDSRTALQTYADGVNAYIRSHRDRLPLEFTILGVDPQPWTPIDSMTWGNMLALDMGLDFRDELLRARVASKLGDKAAQELFLRPGKVVPAIIPGETSIYQGLSDADLGKLAAVSRWVGDPFGSWGSNNWVVHGSRTATGKPMLANDTHLNLQMPSVWYENGLQGGRFNSVGFTLPGVPWVVIGHNQRIAWGITNLDPDVQDVYLEKLDDSAYPTKYEFKGEWHDLDVVHETIGVRGSAPVKLDVFLTRHGPLLNGIYISREAEPAALRWNLYEGSAVLKSIYLLNLATDWDEFRSALQFWDTLSQNFVYADVDGNIGYQTAGRVPIRAPGDPGTLPVPGWTGEYEWQGFIPFGQLPYAFNPPAGFIATANNRVVDDYPYQLSAEWFPGFRARRINSLLAATGRVTLADMRAIQADTYSIPAETLRPYLLAIKPENDLQSKALDKVRAWDMRLDTNSVGASIYETWFRLMMQDTLDDDLAQVSQGVRDAYLHYYPTKQVLLLMEIMPDANNPWFDDAATPQKETRDDIIRRSLKETVNWLSQRYGNDPNGWQWGKMHTMTFVHVPFGQSGIPPLESLFNSKTVPAPGGHFTVNQAMYPGDPPSFGVVHGTAQRIIMDLSNWDNSLAVNSTGQSGQLFNLHREDVVTLWQNVEYYPLYFDLERVKANAEAVLTLTP